MDSLPSDILLELFDIPRPLDAKHLGLANRRRAAAKSRTVCKEAHLICIAKSFERFIAIASDPLVGKRVEKISAKLFAFSEPRRSSHWIPTSYVRVTVLG
jgi:hypothetical protein